MEVRILIGAEAAYACIKSLYHNIDVRLEAGKAPWTSLRNSASEMRQQAAKLQQRAMLIEEAAYLLEEDKIEVAK